MRIATISVILLLGVASTHAIAQDSAGTKRVLTDSPPTGSHIRDTIGSSNVLPVYKRYSELNAEERQLVRSTYEDMPDGDEPPYPSDGLAPIIEKLSRISGAGRYEGDVRIHVAVNSKGEATSVKLMKYPSLEIAKAVAYVLVNTKYKPAVCGGRPCAMEYPFVVELVLR